MISLCTSKKLDKDTTIDCISPLISIPYDINIKVGDILENSDAKMQFIASNRSFLLANTPLIWQGKLLTDFSAGEHAMQLVRPKGLSVACITLSDSGFAGNRVDTSGETLLKLCEENLSIHYARRFLLPDNEYMIKALLTNLAITQGFDLILTTGGTGVASTDKTPDATSKVIDYSLRAIEQFMTQKSLEKTPHAISSRAVAGVLYESIIINLPGSEKAVKECITPLFPAITHTIEKLQGDKSDCIKLYQ